MTFKTKVIWTIVSILSFALCLGIVYMASQKILAMPFRATNDTLHKRRSPLTLDSLIPAGTHIDETMTIGQVIRIRFGKPKGKLNRFVQDIAESIPLKYRLVGTTLFYLFWTLLFLIFFRIFTWMRYILALSISFLAGALVYLFMPDLVLGRMDDVIFAGWAVAFAVAVWWYSRWRKLKSSYA